MKCLVVLLVAAYTLTIAWAQGLVDTTRASDANSESQMVESSIIAQSVVVIPSQPPKRVLCSCVLFAKWLLLGDRYDTQSWGDAGKIQPNVKADEVRVGDYILTREGGGHIAHIWLVTPYGYQIDEGNYERCQQTERFIPVDASSIRGFYRPL